MTDTRNGRVRKEPKDKAVIQPLLDAFKRTFEPLESDIVVITDACTGARYTECHVRASKLIPLGTVNVPLDPDEQPEYRANRDLVEDHQAFETMKADALKRRTFSNLVAEYSTEFDADHPLKIIGGQHRFEAIKLALDSMVDELHGVKVYFDLNSDQRLDVQLISNTNIAASTDLFDRMQETVRGPQLRDWCHKVQMLPSGCDFADKRQRGNPLTVQAARTFIVNYFKGKAIDAMKFDSMDTTPTICQSGVEDTEWENTRKKHAKYWEDQGLCDAGREFAALVNAQRIAIAAEKKKGGNADFAEKALNFAVLSAWAYTAGLLSKNATRLKRHYELKQQKGRDPLNAAALAKGRHKTDSANYRGLGYRTDTKERGRFVELFYLQAEKGDGINPTRIDVAIKKYHAKQAIIEAKEAEDKDKTNA